MFILLETKHYLFFHFKIQEQDTKELLWILKISMAGFHYYKLICKHLHNSLSVYQQALMQSKRMECLSNYILWCVNNLKQQ